MSVTPEPKTTIIITRVTSEPDCSVCVQAAKPTCDPKRVKLTDPGKTSVEFTCPQPQHIYTVEINRAIGMKNLTLTCHTLLICCSEPLCKIIQYII